MANAFIIFGVSVTLGAMAGFGVNLTRAASIEPSSSAVEATHASNALRLASLSSRHYTSSTSPVTRASTRAEDGPPASDAGDADTDADATSIDEEAAEPDDSHTESSDDLQTETSGDSQTASSDDPPPADDSSDEDLPDLASAQPDESQTDSPEGLSTTDSNEPQPTEDASS